MNNQLVNLYIYKFDNNAYQIESYFSDYRLNKIDNSKEIIKNSQIEIMIKYSLEHFIKKNINKLNFNTNDFGKPILDIKDTYLNISHSHNYLFIVISNMEVSVDLQKIDIKNLNISKKILDIIPNNLSKEEITKIFTIKEAYVKYYGKSILYNLKSINNNKEKIIGPEGIINYKSGRYLDYYYTIGSLKESIINTFELNNINNLISINKLSIIDKSNEEEE